MNLQELINLFFFGFLLISTAGFTVIIIGVSIFAAPIIIKKVKILSKIMKEYEDKEDLDQK